MTPYKPYGIYMSRKPESDPKQKPKPQPEPEQCKC